jgi:DNA-binding transcriptional regulator YiaG
MKAKHIATQDEIRRIEDFRLSLGLSVSTAAALLYTTPNVWINWIKGQSSMPLEFTVLWSAKAAGRYKANLPSRITPQTINDIIATVACARRYKHPTIKQAARDMGLSQDALYAWLAKRRRPERARPWLEYYLFSSVTVSRFSGTTPQA